jgi:NADPH-dependent F420 reductase
MGSAHKMAFLGGTGPLGRGLALRLATAGHQCVLGSRDAERARQAASEVAGLAGVEVTGADNADSVQGADVVVVAVPYAAMEPTLTALRGDIADKVVVSCVNFLEFDGSGPRPGRIEAGSAAQECQALLPDARVVGAFHHLSAVTLAKPGVSLNSDVMVVGDDEDANAQVMELVRDLGGARGIHAGPLRLCGVVEDLTAVIIAVNKRYKAHAGIRLTDLE